MGGTVQSAVSFVDNLDPVFLRIGGWLVAKRFLMSLHVSAKSLGEKLVIRVTSSDEGA